MCVCVRVCGRSRPSCNFSQHQQQQSSQMEAQQCKKKALSSHMMSGIIAIMLFNLLALDFYRDIAGMRGESICSLYSAYSTNIFLGGLWTLGS